MKLDCHPFNSVGLTTATSRAAASDRVPYARPMGAEHTSLTVVRDWGESIEFGDDYLRGHCSRVADHADALAGSLDRKSTRLNSSHADISPLPLHDALPISDRRPRLG